MKTTIFSTLWILIFSVVLLSCNKNKEPEALQKQEPPISLPAMVDCHRMVSRDSSAIYTKLIGKWEWEYIQCYWNPEKGNYEDFKGLLVEFKAGNTLEVTVNGQMTQTATWNLVNLNDGYYSVHTSPLVLQLPGRILFCDERVVFSDSYTDGCDNYFKRKN